MAKYEICLHTKNVKLPPDRVAVAGEASATATACLMPPPVCSCSSSRMEPQSLAGPLIWRCLQHALRAFLLLVFRYESRLDKVQEEAAGGGGGAGRCAALASSVCVCVCDRVCVLSWSQILLASLGVGALPLPSSLADLLL